MDASLRQWHAKGERFDYLGFDVFYVREGAGPTLLLVHGYPFSSFDWTPLWERLTRRFTVIAPDMLGMGFSDKPVAYEYSVHDHADMHEALLAKLDVSGCHVMAHDIGDSVVQELLARQEERGSGVIESITWLNGGLFNEAYTPRLVQRLMSRTPLGEVAASLRNLPWFDRVLELTVNEMFGPNTKPSPELMRQFGEIMNYNDGRRVTHKVGRFIVDRYQHRNRWVAAMRAGSVPMRMIDGPCDPNSGRHMAQRYREVIPDPDVVMLGEDIGHWPQIEDPDGVAEHFLAFIDRVAPGR